MPGPVTARRRVLVCASVALVALVSAGCAPAADESDESGAAATPAPTPSVTGSAPRTASPPAGRETSVQRIVDGDTIVVAGGERIRLIGIDTPETVDPRRPVQCFGREASRHITGLIPPGTDVVLEFDVERSDRYGRTLAYVWRAEDALHVNLAMVAGGYAQVATYPPNVAHTDEFVAAQRDAREDGRGLWSACRDG